MTALEPGHTDLLWGGYGHLLLQHRPFPKQRASAYCSFLNPWTWYPEHGLGRAGPGTQILSLPHMNVTESKFLAKSCWGKPGQAAEEEEAAKGHPEMCLHPTVQPSKAHANEQLRPTRMDPISDAAPGKSNWFWWALAQPLGRTTGMVPHQSTLGGGGSWTDRCFYSGGGNTSCLRKQHWNLRPFVSLLQNQGFI